MKIDDLTTILTQISTEFGNLNIEIDEETITQVTVWDEGYRSRSDCTVQLDVIDSDLRLNSKGVRAWRVDDKAGDGHRITHATRPDEPAVHWFVGLEAAPCA